MEPELRLLAACQHHPQLGRHAAEKVLKTPEPVGRVELVQIVDHEHEPLLERFQVGEQALDQRLAAELRRRGDPLDEVLARPHRRAPRSPRARSAGHPVRRARPQPRRHARRGPPPRPRSGAAPSCRCRPVRRRAPPRPEGTPRAARAVPCGGPTGCAQAAPAGPDVPRRRSLPRTRVNPGPTEGRSRDAEPFRAPFRGGPGWCSSSPSISFLRARVAIVTCRRSPRVDDDRASRPGARASDPGRPRPEDERHREGRPFARPASRRSRPELDCAKWLT